MKTTRTPKSLHPADSDRIIDPRWIAALVIALGLAFLFSTSGFQTYWSNERRVIAAAEEIVTALNGYVMPRQAQQKNFPSNSRISRTIHGSWPRATCSQARAIY